MQPEEKQLIYWSSHDEMLHTSPACESARRFQVYTQTERDLPDRTLYRPCWCVLEEQGREGEG